MIRSLVAAMLAALAPGVAFTIDDPRIDEASGLARGLRSPGVMYVQNDSGDVNRFFALDARTGRTAATVTVPGATNVDWEDLAVATDTAGTPSVWLADTGDNDAARKHVRIYRVDEPRVSAGARDRSVTTSRPDVWTLRYPGGPVDAESLAVAPGGAAYVVTKSLTGVSAVYRVPAAPGAKTQTLTQIGSITFSFTGTPGGPNAFGQLTATGAAFSRDGGTFVVRTYTDAYLWAVRNGDLATALKTAPVRVALPEQPQGEGITIDGDRLLVDSEGVGQRVYAVALPRLPSAAVAPPSSPAGTPTRSTGATTTLAEQKNDDGSKDKSSTTPYVLAGDAIIVVVAAIIILRRRRRRRSEPAP